MKKIEYKLERDLIYIDDIELSYGEGVNKKVIVSNFSMREKDVIIPGKITGQIISIIGPSGCGKSTLFKAMTGLLNPSRGKVLINDMSIENKAKVVEAGDIGFIDQTYTLFRHKTIKETIIYAMQFGSNKSLTEKEKSDKANDLMANWGLYNQRDQYPFELSGGQRQRTAILEKIMSSKGFLIMDEPASGLDVKNIEQLKFNINNIAKECETNTTIFSTHDINLAVEMSDSIYVIGKKNKEDSSSQLIQHYDLKEMGLAWNGFSNEHLDLSKEIKKIILNS